MEEEIGGHVDAVLLHDAQGTKAGEGGRSGRFQGDLLVDGPLGVNVPFFCDLGEGLDDLRGGGPGVAGGHVDPRLQTARDDGLVSHEEAHGAFPVIDQV
jgi:hypothetical protein